VLKQLKRLWKSQAGSLSLFEGILLALFVVAVIVAVRLVAFSSAEPNQIRKSITVENKWPELPPRQPYEPFHPLRK
jgi:hypothetical protein